jgi:hypothetical protein
VKKEEKSDNFGRLPLIRSTHRSRRQPVPVRDLNASKVGSQVLVRARIHSIRGKGIHLTCTTVTEMALKKCKSFIFQILQLPSMLHILSIHAVFRLLLRSSADK